ncbi:MAG TPA: phosphoglycerate mutase family protein, partial [Propionibacteriaceae bacterium]|nr:phosphoglycerate mutase family protein [Propionibacteriaceae bacterium]
MTELFLVRHGATEWSRSGRHTSVTDLPLLPDGEVQARRVAGKLADLGLHPSDFGLALSSPRVRALRTAELA